jgi:hypothetical protein
MTTRTKLSTLVLLAAALTSATLIAGSASAKPAQGLRFETTSIRNSGNGTAVARLAAPTLGFKRAPLTATTVSHFSSNGAPTLPGCNSQASCRTTTGGYLNGPHPVGGGEGGNGSPPAGAGSRPGGLPGTSATSGTLPTHACALENCGSVVANPQPRPPGGPIHDPTGGGQTGNGDPGDGNAPAGGSGGYGGDGTSCMGDRDCGIFRQN